MLTSGKKGICVDYLHSEQLKRLFYLMLVLTLGLTACADASEDDDAPHQQDTIDAGSADSPDGGSGPALEPGDHLFTLEHAGLTRVYHVHVPDGFDRGRPAPVIINLHGVNLNGDFYQSYTEMNTAADTRGYLSIYPDGTPGMFDLGDDFPDVSAFVGERGTNSWNGGACCQGVDQVVQDDVAYLKALVDQVAGTYPVDRSRIYIAGMSNGGFMAHRLACEAADWVAAVAPVAGTVGIPPEDCNPAAPIAVLQIMGSDDAVGKGFEGALPIEESHGFWGEKNGCSDTPVETYAKGMVRCEAFPDCKDGVEVELCMAEGGGHNWPNTPYVLDSLPIEDIDNDYILDFFEHHQR